MAEGAELTQVYKLILGFALMTLTSCSTLVSASQNPPPHDPPYPVEWWTHVAKEGAPAWEVLPQEAQYGEVILSKRTELGILSNFAATPFEFKGVKYASVEGFWQATKFPEDASDPRATFPGIKWPYTRAEVSQMTAFEAKEAGKIANENMKKMGIDWVTFSGQKMVYKEQGESPFYNLIVVAMKEKLKQNSAVREVLKKTDGLILRPDHNPGPTELKAWQYHEIWMSLRSSL